MSFDSSSRSTRRSRAAVPVRPRRAVAERFLAAGFPSGDVRIIGPQGDKDSNVIVRMPGSSSARPLLLLAHLDVVEALRSDWSMDPFTFTERDGYFYGRGTSDIKDGAATLIAALLRLKRDRVTPARTLILALTAGEEGGGGYNGVSWLLANHRDLIDAELCLNVDGGDPLIKNGKRVLRSVQSSEKLFLSFRLEVTNPGGHSSLPPKDNAIYHLTAGLDRLAAYQFPVHLNETTRAYFAQVRSARERPDGGGHAERSPSTTRTRPPPRACPRRRSTTRSCGRRACRRCSRRGMRRTRCRRRPGRL